MFETNSKTIVFAKVNRLKLPTIQESKLYDNYIFIFIFTPIIATKQYILLYSILIHESCIHFRLQI
jgi:hypothetical protein